MSDAIYSRDLCIFPEYWFGTKKQPSILMNQSYKKTCHIRCKMNEFKTNFATELFNLVSHDINVSNRGGVTAIV